MNPATSTIRELQEALLVVNEIIYSREKLLELADFVGKDRTMLTGKKLEDLKDENEWMKSAVRYYKITLELFARAKQSPLLNQDPKKYELLKEALEDPQTLAREALLMACAKLQAEKDPKYKNFYRMIRRVGTRMD